MTIIYDIIFLIFALLYFPYLILNRKWHCGFWMRFGIFSQELKDSLREDKRKCIWIHAVSVGEVLTVLELVERIKKNCEDHKIIFSTVTKTGNDLAKEKLGKDVEVIYAPLDFSLIVKKYISQIKPKLYISAETELWPNLYTALDNSGVPIVQVNGRISDKALRGYKRMLLLTKNVLSCVKVFCMQSEMDCSRIISLGAGKDKVHMVGNLKFDGFDDVLEVAPSLCGYGKEDRLFVAGSTHPKEEELIVDVYKNLLGEFKDLRLVIVPRHIERSDEVFRVIENNGLKAVLFSNNADMGKEKDKVLVVDKIGYLRKFYGLSKIVFVGKSFAVGGGQNMIEPAGYGKPTIIGPRAENFKDAVRILLSEKALIQVNDKEEMFAVMQELLRDDQKLFEIGLRAKKAVKKSQGATDRTFKFIKDILK
ncbi:MAG: 3-deoxy-D-manno-octulosonic acid transferase [Candidatus Omnitrophica bacterium]|nr:3-deoxy-D-manno-octulosonic acid transferase [Candidatus Omnitrophota bacterium]MBU4333546.1 3-deoxy-D-manno-octulosonic acid transferase [Candidatus Omnitrophota bacterium]